MTGIIGKFVFSKVSHEIYAWVEFVLENLMWVFTCLAESGLRVKWVEFFCSWVFNCAPYLVSDTSGCNFLWEF